MKLSTLIVLFVSLCAFGSATPGATPPAERYQLTVSEDRVSLRVTDGSVVTLVQDLGRRLGFDVLAEGVDDARITADFDGLSPRDAIRTICKPVTYLEVPDLETGRTSRLVMIPSGGSAANRMVARHEPLAPRPRAIEAAPPVSTGDDGEDR